MSKEKRNMKVLRAFVNNLLRKAILHVLETHEARNTAILHGLPECRADQLFYGKKEA